MRAKTVLLIACGVIIGLTVIAVAAFNGRPPLPPQEAAPPPPDNSIQAQAARARAQGKTEIILSAPDTEFTGSSVSTDLDKALSSYTAVVAQPLKTQSFIAENGEDVVTWQRFRVVETLSERAEPACPACPVPTPPDEFSRVGKGEFVLVKTGGTVNVDGVKVTMSNPSFPDFEPGKKYLLFISKYPSGVATLGIGPKGVFTVDDSGEIRGVNQTPHTVKSDIEGRFNNSLPNLKSHARSVKGRP